MPMTSSEAAAAVAHPIERIGAMFMLHPEVIGDCKERGYPNGYSYYIVGRGGVLGDVDADVVAAGFAFFDPGLIRTMWEMGVGVEGARVAAHGYAARCAEFGRSRLAGWAGAARYAELAARIVDGVEPTGLSLFTGWRAEPRPDDHAGRAYLLTHVLRELRGSQHIAAVAAVGLPAVAAVVVAGGAEQAAKFGWAGELPDADAMRATWDHAERITSALSASAFGVLTVDELAEFVELVDELRVAMIG
jgi:hypothetical protein